MPSPPAFATQVTTASFPPLTTCDGLGPEVGLLLGRLGDDYDIATMCLPPLASSATPHLDPRRLPVVVVIIRYPWPVSITDNLLEVIN